MRGGKKERNQTHIEIDLGGHLGALDLLTKKNNENGENLQVDIKYIEQKFKTKQKNIQNLYLDLIKTLETAPTLHTTAAKTTKAKRVVLMMNESVSNKKTKTKLKLKTSETATCNIQRYR